MSRGFVAALAGLAVTVVAWIGPWSWPAWPAFAVLNLVFGNRFARLPYAGRAVAIVVLIAVNVAFWAAIAYTLFALARRIFDRRVTHS
jgi:hypothetical protein